MATDSLSVRPMTEGDVVSALELSLHAGWNQTAADWLRLLRYEPAGCFVAEWKRTIVATVTTTAYGQSLGWVGMMLVHPDFRRRGVATALMQQAINVLQNRYVRCLKLDATPEGQAVYERLGFEQECDLHRWEREDDAHTAVPAADPTAPFDNLKELDAIAFGANRAAWLRRLAADSVVVTLSDGFGFLRPGSRADALGPVVAASAASACEIVTRLLATSSHRVYWDIPDANLAAADLARLCGFRATRSFRRMWTGESLMTGNPSLQYAIGDPATG